MIWCPIGLLKEQPVFNRFQHAPGLRSVRCQANTEMVIGRWVASSSKNYAESAAS